MGWNKIKIDNHIRAAKLLEKIKNEVFEYIGNRKKVSEFEIQQFIIAQYKKYGLKTDNPPTPIVAFGKNTSFVHYFPSRNSSILKPETLIMIDIWARLKKANSPFADITWMGYYGKNIPVEVVKIFNVVMDAREEVIKFITNELKKEKLIKNREVDKVARDIIKKKGFENNFLHTTGHSLGFISPHGGKRLGPKSCDKVIKGIGYTIEPGVYIKDKFGVRSEINFYISEENKIIITTGKQKSIFKIK